MEGIIRISGETAVHAQRLPVWGKFRPGQGHNQLMSVGHDGFRIGLSNKFPLGHKGDGQHNWLLPDQLPRAIFCELGIGGFRGGHNLPGASGCGQGQCLAHDKLRESMLLEEIGFRFIEMLYQPTLDLAKAGAPTSCDHGMTVSTATEQDMPRVLAIAGSAFQNERIHMDPRLPSRLGDMRYQNWARDALTHSSQRLKILREKNEIVAFFVTEDQPDKTCYWHLNAVAPDAQGRGVGRRTWRAMLEDAQLGGAKRVQTSIVARNNRVLNLYASLAFTFPPPLMTFHWVRRT